MAGVRRNQYSDKIREVSDVLKNCTDAEIVSILHEVIDDTPFKTRNYTEYSHDEYYIVHNKREVIQNSIKEYPLSTSSIKSARPLIDSITGRKSLRDYAYDSVSFDQFSEIIHYSFGVKSVGRGAYDQREFPFKFCNSQGGLNYLDLYIVVSNVEGLPQGLYYFDFINDQVCLVQAGNMRTVLKDIHFANEFVAYGAFTCFVVADLSRVMPKYYKRAYRMAHVDAGILVAYLELIAESIDIHSCTVAGYLEHKLDDLLNLTVNDYPVVSITFGKQYAE
ncbi:SagB/ThcOx family dehydrogenase [Lacticaseibacillus casei]|uniref:Nitroreductase n=1 Tax=Lacticaseibacillus casei TaxID=1582 RepID=A0AAN1KFQ3_LACCA|nr:nitroreductase [Lacticaseibacillus casei]KAB1970227.1 SagB/ThcOx family dehydrogenase [Lacticaseibacillus casei]